MSKPLRVLVSGDVEGKFNQLFNRVNTVQKKSGSFDLLYCVGDFFGKDNSEWEDYKNGTKKVPITTYVLGPSNKEHSEYFTDSDGGDLCENVTYLGRRGTFMGSSGLHVAYLSGTDGTTNEGGSTVTHFHSKDVDALRLPLIHDSKFRGVDILLTSQWPTGVEKYAKAVDGMKSDDVGSPVISQLALSLRPRYHFCAREGAHYERLPYRNHKVLQDNARQVTRFIALSKVGNPEKKKYLYAFQVSPMKHMDEAELTKQPSDVTETPYRIDTAAFKSKEQNSEKSAQFFYDQKSLDRGSVQTGGRGQGRKRQHGGEDGERKPKKHPQPTGPCWFCLGSPEVEKHLVISVGDTTYLAMAKGGLTPEHVLITPIGHHQSQVSAPPEVVDDIKQYATALKKFYRKQGKALVLFERNYKTQHMQVQAVPVPEEVVGDLKETFMGCALAQEFELHEIPKHSDLKQIVPEGAPYFYAELPSGEKLLFRIKKGFPLQFGREVLAHDTILDMPHRIDWKNCKSSKGDEVAITQAFREGFGTFDPHQM